MKLMELKCKNCGATLKVNLELHEVYCTYCGNKMIIDDDATSIDRIENVKLKSRKNNHEQSMKEKLDNYEFYKKVKEEERKSKTRIPIFLTLTGIVIVLVGLFVGEFVGEESLLDMGICGLGGWILLFGIIMLIHNAQNKE